MSTETQGELLNYPRHLAKSTGPKSSKLAALGSTKFAASHKGRILADLGENGPSTHREIAIRCGFPEAVQVSRRLTDLKRERLVAILTNESGNAVMRGGSEVHMLTDDLPTND